MPGRPALFIRRVPLAGLHVVESGRAGPRGHVVLPELDWLDVSVIGHWLLDSRAKEGAN